MRDLKKGGFTLDQSVTLTKAVRGLLGVNLDIARQGLVSKSDMENVGIRYKSSGGFFPSLLAQNSSPFSPLSVL